MKKYTIIFILALAVPCLVFGQDDDDKDIKSIFSKGTKVQGFGSFDMKITEMVDDVTLLLGGHGGLIINKHTIVGIGGYGITTNNRFRGIVPNEDLDLFGGYGGLVLGYILAPREIVHISFPVLIGAGGLEVSDGDFFSPSPGDLGTIVERSAFFIVEPGAEAEINVTKFFRIGLGASYRLITGTDLTNISDDDVSGLSGQISFKFGNF
ncbi:MAG: hypothetical protein AAFX87_15470 [Bacteroidota bacterium]